MKFFSFLIFSVLILSMYELRAQVSYENLDTLNAFCKIKKIKKSKHNTGYVIFAEVENYRKLNIVIVTLPLKNTEQKKIKKIESIKKIEENKIYYFKLFSYHSQKIEDGVLFTATLVDCQKIDIGGGKCIIINETHEMRSVYATTNLYGLYYIPSYALQITP